MNPSRISLRGVRAVTVTSLLFLSGCATVPDLDKPTAANSGPPAPAATMAEPPSSLSYGTVTSQVQKGRTTQFELIQLFGGPNIATTDAEGLETWIYERTVSSTNTQAQSKDLAAAANLNAFFSLGNAGVSGSAARNTGQVSTSSSIRSLTVIVKFNPDKTVKDYSVRSSTF